MTVRLLLQIGLLSVLSGSAFAETFVYPRANTIGRYDYQTTGERTRVIESSYTGAVLMLTFSDDDTNGTTNLYYDVSPLSNDGSATNSPTWLAADGGVVLFNGTTEMFAIPDSDSLDSPSVTLMAWVNHNIVVGSHVLFNKGDVGNTSFVYRLAFIASGRMDVRIGNNGRINAGNAKLYQTASGAAPTGQWTHVAITYDGTDLEIYANGIVLSGVNKIFDAAVGDLFGSSADVIIGAQIESGAQVSHYTGLADGLRIYPSGLSSNAVFNIYTSTTNTYGVN